MSYEKEHNNITDRITYKAGQSAGCYNIFEDGKYKSSCTMTELDAMIKAKSRFKKDYKKFLDE